MGDEIEIKDLGNPKYFLRIEIARFREGISVSQRKYILDLLAEIGMMGYRLADTPTELNAKLGNSSDRICVDKEKYQGLVRKLIYLSHTKPDISYVVRIVNQIMQAPYEDHMKAVNRILRKSISGYCSFMWGTLVTLRSKKQGVVARINAEAEYRDISLEICEKIRSK
ncbi:putative mitochondrial protein [Cucumis melo var. makuwa]|uniref:Mitochondrial protein n=1 Tax=Cucumis melo var. makuwa TaxID=1194695 RepID=A0A5D3CA07_CUCMM|nr:putative mitochondrial protein [Cucumis melo var. makuwa]TYK07136.1 putative mitochondrial protein [Cucumis melo var. makuwa]